MQEKSSLVRMATQVEELSRLAQDLYNSSEEFPAVNCNAKRVLAAVEVLRINLEEVAD